MNLHNTRRTHYTSTTPSPVPMTAFSITIIAHLPHSHRSEASVGFLHKCSSRGTNNVRKKHIDHIVQVILVSLLEFVPHVGQPPTHKSRRTEKNKRAITSHVI